MLEGSSLGNRENLSVNLLEANRKSVVSRVEQSWKTFESSLVSKIAYRPHKLQRFPLVTEPSVIKSIKPTNTQDLSGNSDIEATYDEDAS